MNDIFVIAVIVSIVEAIKRLVARFGNGLVVSGTGTIILSGVVGAVLGQIGSLIGFPGLTPGIGFGLGLAAAGVHQVATAAGGK